MKKLLMILPHIWIIFLIPFVVNLDISIVPAQTLSNVPVEIRIPNAPIPVKAYGQVLLGYELHITNFRATDITLNRVDVFSQDAIDQPIASYQDANLMNSIARPGAPSSLADTRAIGGGMRAVVYLWLTFDKVEAVPHSLRHRFLFTIADSGDKSEERMMEAARIDIPKEAPVVISAPLQDGNWAAGNGPSNGSIHRRALIPVTGQARIAQRFAIDWVQLGDDGKAWHGDSQENQNWYGYGAEVLAVADGVVAEVKDGIPENVPLSPTRAVPITLETVGGNHVILDLGNGKFAFYAHLQPNSIRAKIGQRVDRGQVLGLLGNSGNSDAPHLHFHVSNENSPLGAEGLPFVFESFEVLGTASLTEVMDQGWKQQSGATQDKRLREMPVENLIIKFR